MYVFQPHIILSNMSVFVPAHTSRSARQRSKLCAIHSLLYRHRRCGCTLGTAVSPDHKSPHLGRRWSSHPPGIISFELLSLSYSHNHCWFDGFTSAESQMHCHTASSGNIWKRFKVRHGKGISASCMRRLNL